MDKAVTSASSPFWRAVVHSRTVQRGFVWTMKRLFRLRNRKVELAPPPGPYIFASNHASHYDIFLAFAIYCDWATRHGLTHTLPVSTLWEPSFDIPIFGGILKAVPCVGVDRTVGGGAKRARAVREMIGHLRSGRSLIVGCEGKRGDHLDEFEQGAAYMSLRSGVPVVPITLRGVQGLYSELARPNRFWGNVEVVAHEPLQPAAFEVPGASRAENVARFTQAIRDRVASQLDYPAAVTVLAGS